MTTLELAWDAEGIREAARLLRAGEVVAIPTETVYGLAADALNPAAVAKIFAAKGRPQDNPLIVHIDCYEMMKELVDAVPDTARTLADAFWPGPLTLVLRHNGRVPSVVTAGLDTVAVRMPSHPLARAVIAEAGRPLAAPSANRSGSPSPTTAAHVLADLDGRIAAVLHGGASEVGLESTVVDATGSVPVLLRPGGVTPAMLRDVAGELVVDPAVTGPLSSDRPAASPGMKYRHYAPRTRLVLVRGDASAFAAFVNARAAHASTAALCFDGEEAALSVPCLPYGRRDDPADQARRIFETLRRLDGLGADIAYCAAPRPEGVGLAVYNRLLRAAEFDVRDAARDE